MHLMLQCVCVNESKCFTTKLINEFQLVIMVLSVRNNNATREYYIYVMQQCSKIKIVH